MHNETYESFCKKHDCPCCKKCLQNHDVYKGLTDIDNIIHDVKSSSAFLKIEHIHDIVREVAENIKRLITKREQNLATFTKKRSEIEMGVNGIRKMINDYLDKIQDEMLKELKATEEKESSKIRQLINSLKQKEEEISELQDNIASIKKYDSELQTFLTMKQMEEDIKKKITFNQLLKVTLVKKLISELQNPISDI
ncbi:unnamed protein product [Mytilus edulis]|uniref:Uncharacterized protein n=1 Tax=Mytilus edulis TaxID=6550 RepID=A0A8S3TA87_MYTED|nr:unnamed protein product [Mytilus edulis]